MLRRLRVRGQGGTGGVSACRPALEKSGKKCAFFCEGGCSRLSTVRGIPRHFHPVRAGGHGFFSVPLNQPAPEPPAGGQGWPCGETTHDAPLAAGVGETSPQCPSSARRSRLFLHAVDTTPRCASRSVVRPPREQGIWFQFVEGRHGRLTPGSFRKTNATPSAAWTWRMRGKPPERRGRRVVSPKDLIPQLMEAIQK